MIRKINYPNVFIFGKSSVISKKLKKKFPKAKLFSRKDEFKDPSSFVKILNKKEINIIIYVSAILRNKNFVNQTKEEIIESFEVNSWNFIQIVEKINDRKLPAKLIYLSSESAEKGSFDTSYWLSKSSTESFIKECVMKNKKSSIIGIAPSTIEDTNMTLNRNDNSRLKRYKTKHPKKRFLKSNEIVSLIEFLIKFDSEYLTNEIIKINGGKFARRKD
tara:strand:- start:26 stop:679 length:654 start_codon:yes stop_codon:yes gene_type:complete